MNAIRIIKHLVNSFNSNWINQIDLTIIMNVMIINLNHNAFIKQMSKTTIMLLKKVLLIKTTSRNKFMNKIFITTISMKISKYETKRMITMISIFISCHSSKWLFTHTFNVIWLSFFIISFLNICAINAELTLQFIKKARKKLQLIQ